MTATAATADQKRLAIVGATGMVGGYALRYMLDDPAIGVVTAIGRRKVGISHPKLKEVLHRDFADCSALAETLSGQDASIFCLGTYTGVVSDAELRTTTVNYTIEFGVLIPEREWRGPDRTESDCLRTVQGRGREGTTRDRVPPRVRVSARVHLSRRATEGTEFQLPRAASNLSRLSRLVPQPGGSGGRPRTGHGGRRSAGNRGAPRTDLREP